MPLVGKHQGLPFQTLSGVSQALMCTGITWGCWQNSDSDPVGLGWGLRFCISNEFARDTNAFVHENKVDVFVHKDSPKLMGDTLWPK